MTPGGCRAGWVSRRAAAKITLSGSPASMSPSPPSLSLAHGLAFADLYRRPGLQRIDAAFDAHVREADEALHARYSAARAAPGALAYKDEAELLIALAPHLDRFVAELFGIEAEWDRLVGAHHELEPLFRVKRKFVQRRAMLKIKADAAAELDGAALEADIRRRLGGTFDELEFARRVLTWLADEPAHADDLAAAERFSAWAAHTPEGQRLYRGGVLFKPPRRVDPM